MGVEESLEPHGFKWSDQYQWEGENGLPVDSLNFPSDMKQPDLPPVVYHHRVEGGGLVWDQYWLWYLYNPWAVGGVGRHEGDWEIVQIGSTPGPEFKPILMTCSQHHNGGKREYWAVETSAYYRPVVYVALGSHANYFTSGRQGGGIDSCDGQGRLLANYELREFGPWVNWKGRWGNSTGEGKSPESPANQTLRWNQPHIYHAHAR